MTIRPAHKIDLPQVRDLLRYGRHRFVGLGDEDLPGILQDGVTALGESDNVPWGFLGIQVEERPRTLPLHAATRAHILGMALASGRSPQTDLPRLLNTALTQSAPSARYQMIYFGQESWPVKPLQRAGFALVERVEFLQISRLDRRNLDALQPAKPPIAQLRPVRPDDVAALAQLDAETFDPIWHLGKNKLLELLLTSRVQIAEYQKRLVGYAALSTGANAEAYLARLAVHESVRGQGLGRHLLLDSLSHARTIGMTSVTLNTQTDNQPSQHLYRAVGFRPTGAIFPVLVKSHSQHFS